MKPTVSPRSLCFVATGPAMPGVLTMDTPDRIGGAELQLKELAFRLADRGWQVSFVLGHYGKIGPCLHRDIRLVEAHEPHAPKSLISRAIGDTRRIWRALDEANAGIYCENGLGATSAVAAHYARTRGRSFVLWMASDSDPQCMVPAASRVPRSQRRLAFWALKKADLLLAQSVIQQELAQRHVGREAPILPNLWPGPYECRVPDRAHESVLWVGSIRQVKRPLLAIEVARSLPGIPFTMAGGPVRGDEALYSEVVAAAEATPNLDFVGFVPPNLVDRHYAQCAMLVCTSKVEGFPNTFLHAWGRGRPVVSSYDPGRLLAGEGFGAVGDTAAALASAVRRLWNDPAECQSMGAKASRYVKVTHHPDVIISRLESLLEEQTGRRLRLVREPEAAAAAHEGARDTGAIGGGGTP